MSDAEIIILLEEEVGRLRGLALSILESLDSQLDGLRRETGVNDLFSLSQVREEILRDVVAEKLMDLES